MDEKLLEEKVLVLEQIVGVELVPLEMGESCIGACRELVLENESDSVYKPKFIEKELSKKLEVKHKVVIDDKGKYGASSKYVVCLYFKDNTYLYIELKLKKYWYISFIECGFNKKYIS